MIISEIFLNLSTKGSTKACVAKPPTNCLLSILLMMWRHTMSCLHQKHQQKNLSWFWSLVITVSALQEISRSKQSEKLGNKVGRGGWRELCCRYSDSYFLCDWWKNKEVLFFFPHQGVWNMSLDCQRELKSVYTIFSLMPNLKISCQCVCECVFIYCYILSTKT